MIYFSIFIVILASTPFFALYSWRKHLKVSKVDY